jgi:hypothetical protein
VSNDDFRRELGQAFDDMTGSPSAALPDRVRSSLARVPDQRGPFWIAGVAAAVIAAVVIGVLFVANPLNHRPTAVVPGAGSSPTPSASLSPSPTASVSPDSNLPAFVCSSGIPAFAGPNPPGPAAVGFIDAVRLGTHTDYDRITIEFSSLTSTSAEVTSQSNANFTQGASGQPVALAGSAGLLITMRGADEHTNYNGPIDFKTGYAVLVEARQVQDFEGIVQWGLGLSKSACYRAFFLSKPYRLVIDVQSG